MDDQQINASSRSLLSTLSQNIDKTGTIVGVILLLTPYICIIIPYLREYLINILCDLYIHKTPRTQWNTSVDGYPPRRIAGFLVSLISLTIPVLIIQYYNYNKAIDFWFNLFQYIVYISLPILMSIIRPSSHSPCDIGDILILIFILLPLQLSDYGSFSNNKFLPDILITLHSKLPKISMLRITSLNIGICIYYIFRPLEDIGLGYDNLLFGKYVKSYWVLIRWIIAAIVFVIVAVPIAVSLNFIKDSHAIDGNVWMNGVLKYFLFLFLYSLPFEFLFRGIVQNLLHSWADSRAQERKYMMGGFDSPTNNSPLRTNNNDGYDAIVRRNSHSINEDAIPNNNDINIKMQNSHSNNKQKPLTKLSDPYSDVTHATHHYYETTQASAAITHENAYTNNNKNNNLNVPVNILDSSGYASSNDGYEHDGGHDMNNDRLSKQTSFLPKPKDDCNKGFLYWLNFYHLRDWTCLIVSSVFYAIIVIHWNSDSAHSDDLIAGFFIAFWLGCCCGWIWRHTNSVFASAILNSLILFVANNVFTPIDEPLCNGAC